MAVLIIYHSPRKRITLYDAKRDSEFSGTLIFQKDEETVENQNSASIHDAKIDNTQNEIVEESNFANNFQMQIADFETENDFEPFQEKVKPQKETKKSQNKSTIRLNFVPFLIFLIKIIEWLWNNLIAFYNKSKLFIDKAHFKSRISDFFNQVKLKVASNRDNFKFKKIDSGDWFSKLESSKNLVSNISIPKSEYFPRPQLPKLELPKIKLPQTSLRQHYSKFSMIFLVIAFFSFVTVIGPFVLADLSLKLPVFGADNTPKKTPAPTYNSYFSPEKDPIYPIREFRIVVPKINLESNIVDNVDPNIAEEYKEKLMYGVAHAKGSYLPGQDGPVFLFAHSTDTVFNIARFNAKFFSVRELENGDEILLYLNGKEFKYTVNGKKVINPEEIDEIRNSNTGLVLQTCWPPGTDWQRLIVFADPVLTN